jgi:NAD(P)-dependent dehydrogenase (short-subunit alcohol dehydrogenase family)
MDLGHKDKRVLITGGSKGIGLACALGFAAEGASIAICSRSQENINQALARLPGAIGIAADCSNADAAAAMVDRVEAERGPIDILVNSAGAARRSPPGDLTPAFWRAAMDAKYFSTINVVDPLIKRMAARGRGVIVNIIGVGGKIASPTHLAGGAANAALMLATAGLGSAYARSGIRVIGVSPSVTETDRVTEGLAAEAAATGVTVETARARSIEKMPLGRMAMPADIANAVLFLASEQASYITGMTIAIDGGQNPIVL